MEYQLGEEEQLLGAVTRLGGVKVQGTAHLRRVRRAAVG
jgi:hypothetical protein